MCFNTAPSLPTPSVPDYSNIPEQRAPSISNGLDQRRQRVTDATSSLRLTGILPSAPRPEGLLL